MENTTRNVTSGLPIVVVLEGDPRVKGAIEAALAASGRFTVAARADMRSVQADAAHGPDPDLVVVGVDATSTTSPIREAASLYARATIVAIDTGGNPSHDEATESGAVDLIAKWVTARDLTASLLAVLDEPDGGAGE